MFAAVTARETGRHAASRALWLLGSTGLQATLVAALAAASLAITPPVEEAPPIVPVVLPPRPRPPAPPRPPQATGAAHPTRPLPPASALLQPQEIAPVASVAPGPPDPLPADAGPGDGEWIPGTAPTGQAALEEEAVFALTGFRAPAMATRGCVQQHVRVPRDLAGFASGPVVVKFAIGRDGTPGRFSVVGGAVPERLAGAIWQAVQGCRWVAGADPSGRPVAIWVVMPLRFTAE